MELKAVRNLRLCTKDCLCLYVCPYGAPGGQKVKLVYTDSVLWRD